MSLPYVQSLHASQGPAAFGVANATPNCLNFQVRPLMCSWNWITASSLLLPVNLQKETSMFSDKLRGAKLRACFLRHNRADHLLYVRSTFILFPSDTRVFRPSPGFFTAFSHSWGFKALLGSFSPIFYFHIWNDATALETAACNFQFLVTSDTQPTWREKWCQRQAWVGEWKECPYMLVWMYVADLSEF